MSVQLSHRKIGKITLDATVSETHQSDLTITENPIESGALIADHAVLKPKQVQIQGVMVDHDTPSLADQMPTESIRGVVDFLDTFPLPVPIINHTTQTLAKASRVLNQAQYVKQQAQEQARKLAPWLPPLGLLGEDASDKSSRVQQCYADLVTLQQQAELIEVQTGIHLYKNMLLESVSVVQRQDGSATFDIQAREIVIVSTAISQVKSSTPIGKRQSGRAANQSAPKAQQGNVQTKPAKSSALSNIVSR